MSSSHVRPEEITAGQDEKISDPRDWNAEGFMSARVSADERLFCSAPLPPRSTGAWANPLTPSTCETFGDPPQSDHAAHERCVEPTAPPTASAPSATSPHHPGCSYPAIELNSEDVVHGGIVCEHDVSGVATSTDTFLVEPDVLGDEVVDEAEDNDIGAADWLDVTHSLLDEAHRHG